MRAERRIVRDLHFDDYWDDPAVSSSTLKKFLQLPTPAHVKHAIDNPSADTEALILGRLLHCILLEPDRLDSYFVIERAKLWEKTKLGKNGGSKEAWDALKAEAEALLVPLIPHEMWVKAEAMAANIQALDLWQGIAKHGEKEISVFGEIQKQKVKARYDVLYGSAIFDIKSTRYGLTDQEIAKVIADNKYHLSASMYLAVGKAAGLTVDRFVWFFVENTAPFLCRPVEATPTMLKTGEKEFLYCLSKYKQGMEGYWPGYDRDSAYIDLPQWYRFEDAK